MKTSKNSLIKYIVLSGISFDAPPQFANLENIDFNGLLSIAINFLLVTAAMLFFFMFLLGGLRMILSGGKKEGMDAARQHITNAFIGLVIVFSSWAILSFIESVFGVNLVFFHVSS